MLIFVNIFKLQICIFILFSYMITNYIPHRKQENKYKIEHSSLKMIIKSSIIEKMI